MKHTAGEYRLAKPALREARKARGLHIPDVAARVGVSRQFLAVVERGTQRAPRDLQRALARQYTVPIADLFAEPRWPETDQNVVARGLVAVAGACGSPTCQDPDCTVTPGRCHREGCGESASIAPQTRASDRMVKGMPTVFCGRSCSHAAMRARRAALAAEGLISAEQLGKRLNRAPINVMRCAWTLTGGRSIGRQIAGLGPRGGQWFFTEDEAELIKERMFTSKAAVVHENDRRRADWFWARHEDTRPYSKLADPTKKTGRRSSLTEEQKEQILVLARKGQPVREIADEVLGDRALFMRAHRFLRR